MTEIPKDLQHRYHAVCINAAVTDAWLHDVCVKQEKIYIERIALAEQRAEMAEEQVKRLTALVSDKEWMQFANLVWINNQKKPVGAMFRTDVDALLAERGKGKL